MPETPVFDEGRARQIIAEHLGLEGPLLPILHAFSEEFGFVSDLAVPLLAEALISPVPKFTGSSPSIMISGASRAVGMC